MQNLTVKNDIPSIIDLSDIVCLSRWTGLIAGADSSHSQVKYWQSLSISDMIIVYSFTRYSVIGAGRSLIQRHGPKQNNAVHQSVMVTNGLMVIRYCSQFGYGWRERALKRCKFIYSLLFSLPSVNGEISLFQPKLLWSWQIGSDLGQFVRADYWTSTEKKKCYLSLILFNGLTGYRPAIYIQSFFRITVSCSVIWLVPLLFFCWWSVWQLSAMRGLQSFTLLIRMIGYPHVFFIYQFG